MNMNFFLLRKIFFKFSVGRDDLPSISMDKSLEFLLDIRQEPIHDALLDCRHVEQLCSAAAEKLGYASYTAYINQHIDEIFT